jgi:DNA-directed RNA polymerase specialized sigma24 family protein
VDDPASSVAYNRGVELTADIVEGARRGNTRDASVLLTSFYPTVYRMAYGLSGRDDVGREIVRTVMRQSLHVMESWQQESAPERWFIHHTVLTARRGLRHRPEIHEDTLVRGHEDDSQYTAFVRAVRNLTFQQKEAVILHHAGGFDIRKLAQAMDCSTEAASNHLRTGTTELEKIANENLAGLLKKMKDAYMALAPGEEIYLPMIESRVRRFLWRRRLGRFVMAFLVAAILGLAAYFGWFLYRFLDI